MNCGECLNFLEAYVDGETTERVSEQVRNHLATCASCEKQLEVLTAESELYVRYDRELEISPALWNGIAARIAAEDRQVSPERRFSLAEWFAGLFAAPSWRYTIPALAVLVVAIVIGLAYFRTKPEASQPGLTAQVESPTSPLPPNKPETAGDRQDQTATSQQDKTPTQTAPPRDNRSDALVAVNARTKPQPARATDQSDVYPDSSYKDIEERDTASHLEQAQNLLTSFRSIKFADDDEEVDVSYEKAESRRLLSENIVLRREAESAGKFPTKSVLGSLEPFLIDIANLPEKAKPSEVRQITDRVQRTEIVAELRSY